MAISPIGVITEFKFEIGAALLGTQSLTTAVDGLNSSVDQAINSTANLGLAFAANLGFGGGSLLGLASTAIQTSEAFDDVSRSFSTIISANKDKLTGTIETFNDRLGTSAVIIKDIVKDARTFGLDEKSLLNTTKLMSATLAPKGLVGKNFEGARNISRDLLKAAPLLGVDPTMVEGQLLRLIGGQASMGDTLFRRLSAETKSFQPFNQKGGAKSFNILPVQKRLQILQKGLGQFTNDTEVLADRMNSLNNQFIIFKQIVRGVDGILRPIGEVIKKPLVRMMADVNNILDTTGRRIAINFATIFEDMLSSPRSLLTTMIQLKYAGEDLNRTSSALGRAGIVGGITFMLNKFLGLPKVFIGISSGISILGSVLEKMSSGIVPDFVKNIIGLGTKIAAGASFVGLILAKFGLLMPAFALLAAAFKVVILPAMALFAVMQLISRAIAIQRLKDAALIPSLLEKTSLAFSEMVTAGREIMGVVMAFVDSIASAIAPMFSAQASANGFILMLNALKVSLDFVRDTVLITGATFHGLANFLAAGFHEATGRFTDGMFNFMFTVMDVIGTVFTNIPTVIRQMAAGTDFLDVDINGTAIGQMMAGGGDMLSASLDTITNSFDDGFNQFLEKAIKPTGEGGQAFVQQTTNINGDIKITNEFKEQQEPDRVAFTIKDQLLRAAQNPTAAFGQSISNGLVGR